MQTCSTKEKDNGIRPIGVGECLRRTIGKTNTGVPKEDIVCAGEVSGY